MTDIEIDITGRMTAFQEALSFLMAHHLANLDESTAEAVSSSFLGRKRGLGAGMMDAEDLQAIGRVADNTLSMILGEAAHMAAEYRRLRAE